MAAESGGLDSKTNPHLDGAKCLNDQCLDGIDAIFDRHCGAMLRQLQAQQEALARQLCEGQRRTSELMEQLLASCHKSGAGGWKHPPPPLPLPKQLPAPQLPAPPVPGQSPGIEDCPKGANAGGDRMNGSLQNTQGGSFQNGIPRCWDTHDGVLRREFSQHGCFEQRRDSKRKTAESQMSAVDILAVLPGSVNVEGVASKSTVEDNGRFQYTKSHTMTTNPDKTEKWAQFREAKGNMLERAKAKKKKRKKATVSSEGTKAPLQRITESRYFELFSTLAIILNTIFIGVQVQYQADQGPNYRVDDLAFFLVEFMFILVFTSELVMRLIVEGKEFLFGSDKHWNIFDLIVVIISTAQLVAEFAIAAATGGNSVDQGGLENVSSIRLIRLIRITRVLRVIKVIRAFRELRMMISSIVASMQSLLWSMVVLWLCFFMFGACLTIGTLDHFMKENLWTTQDPDLRSLFESFGSLDAAILSLYQAMSGGVDWGDLLALLRPLPWVYRALYVVYISFSVFAVVNIVTGIFVENAMQASSMDKDNLIQLQEMEREQFLVAMQDLFMDVDVDDNGSITEQEFNTYLKDDRAVSYFSALKLEIDEIQMLFHLLDHDGSGSVEIDEFLQGCRKLAGESKAIDLHILQLEVKWLCAGVNKLEGVVYELGTNLLSMATPPLQPAASHQTDTPTSALGNGPMLNDRGLARQNS